jgi:hypothetical protein
MGPIGWSSIRTQGRAQGTITQKWTRGIEAWTISMGMLTFFLHRTAPKVSMKWDEMFHLLGGQGKEEMKMMSHLRSKRSLLGVKPKIIDNNRTRPMFSQQHHRHNLSNLRVLRWTAPTTKEQVLLQPAGDLLAEDLAKIRHLVTSRVSTPLKIKMEGVLLLEGPHPPIWAHKEPTLWDSLSPMVSQVIIA